MRVRFLFYVAFVILLLLFLGFGKLSVTFLSLCVCIFNLSLVFFFWCSCFAGHAVDAALRFARECVCVCSRPFFYFYGACASCYGSLPISIYRNEGEGCPPVHRCGLTTTHLSIGFSSSFMRKKRKQQQQKTRFAFAFIGFQLKPTSPTCVAGCSNKSWLESVERA